MKCGQHNNNNSNNNNNHNNNPLPSPPRNDVDRLYISRKEGGRGLASIEDSVDASIPWLKDYMILTTHKG